ncbi:MAG: AAA family ATPase [Nitrospirae bacterium]|nr:AAA family ATPase [Nitrospirota bacterium]
MYEKHFNFKYKPFDLVPNPDFLFLSKTHHKAITYLNYGIKEKVGFILLTGEIGSGKTTIIRNLIKNLEGTIRLSKINNTKVSSEQLISMINEDFGLDVEGKNKTRLLSELNLFLVDQYSKKLQPVLLIDEAQNLSADLLEEIRLLSNLETDRAKLVQIILVGQPELKKTLMLPELLQLRQRISVSYHIAPLTIDETADYIRHRLAIAGNPEAIKFQDDMLNTIYRFSRGIPRLINILCDFTLLSAYVEGSAEVTAGTVGEVARDLESGDYWNESQVAAEPESGRTRGGLNLEDIALRLIRLEEKVNNNISEITSMSDKIGNIGNDTAEVIKIFEKSGTTEILDLLKELKNAPVGVHLQAEKENHAHGELRHLEDQIESATKIIICLNERLKGL